MTEENIRNTYLECTLSLDGEVHSNTVLLFVKPKHFEFVDPDLDVEVREESEQFILSVQAKAGLAKYVELDLLDADCKFSDNYFDLSAGEVREIIVQKDSLSEGLDLEEMKEKLKIRSIYNTY